MGVTITIGGTDRTLLIPFDTGTGGAGGKISIDETLGGVGTMKMELWDLANAVTIADLASVVVTDTGSGKNLFQGIVQKRGVRVQGNYRIYTLDCVDLNYILTTTLVGVPNGSDRRMLYVSPFLNIDPNAAIYGGSDAANLQRLISAYWLYGVALDMTTYVQTVNPRIGYPDPLYWSRSNLRSSLDDLASLSSQSTAIWIDPDAKVHLAPFPSGGGGGTYVAPYVLADVAGPVTVPLLMGLPRLMPQSPAASSPALAYSNFSVDWDYSGYAFSIYANGGTDYTLNSGLVTTGGTGWVALSGLDGGPSWMSRYLDVPGATTQAERNAFGWTALRTMNTPLVRGSCSVTGTSLMFHAGQWLTVVNTVSGLGTVTYPIQRATTTFRSGTDIRDVHLEWGTAPQNRVGFRAKTQPKPVKSGATAILVSVDWATPNASGTVNVTGQLINAANEPWALQNKTVTWSCTVYNSLGTDVTSTTTFTISPVTSVTDARGIATTTLTVSATTGLDYVMSGSVPD